MTAPAATEAQIRARVIQLIRERDEKIFALRSQPRWTGAEIWHADKRAVRMVPCPSALAVRQALIEADARKGAERVVLLTDRSERDLGDDVLARLAGRRLFSLSPWETLKGLFRAHAIDPRLADDPELATALIEAVPSGGFPAAPGGFLTADLAWGTLIEHRLGLPRDPTLEDLLTWGAEERATVRWTGASEQVRAGIRRRLEDRLGPAAIGVLDLIERGAGNDAVPLGLVLRALFASDGEQSEARVAARVRLEAHVPTQLPHAAALTWADEAERLVRRRLGAGAEGQARTLLQRAGQLLGELGARELAHLSDFLEDGFDQRLVVAAQAAVRHAESPESSPPASLLDDVERHVLARLEPHRARAARMAARLARWLALQHDRPWQPPSFTAAAVDYAWELSFVDWARRILWAGDRTPSVDGAFRRLTELADEVRMQIDLRFASMLAGWTATGGSSSDELVLLEDLLDDVVAPLAKQQPVLVVVADGMSADIAHELVGELVRRGWAELARTRIGRPVAGVACLPTVTEVCRTTLLSGKLQRGDQGREGRRFAAHPALVSASGSGAAPVLVHRGDLTKEGAQRLTDPVSQAVANPRQRVVGVVVNAVDDLLIKGGMVRPDWTPEVVPVLGALVQAARNAGRAVVLVADHGHVDDRGTEYVAKGEGGGERWREADSAPDEREILLEGPRVVLGNGRIIAAATETTRYSSSKRDGYHGGATPREVVVPLRVLRAPLGEIPTGWEEVATPVPGWWDGLPSAPAEQAPAAASRRPAQQGQQSLFAIDGKGGPSAGGWIDAVLDSEVYRQQVDRLGARARPDDARVRAVLQVLDARDGVSTRVALARAAGIPEVRIDGVLSAMRRLLAVDGYAPLTIAPDGDTVRLDADLLRRQFGV